MNDIIWRPTKEIIEKSNVKRLMDKAGVETSEELLKWSTDNINEFWDACVKDLDIRWFSPYTKVNDWEGGNFHKVRWFIDGKTNIILNCIDKHLPKSAHKIAMIWEGNEGDSKSFTYKQLNDNICKIANAMKKLGVTKGDRVGIYMPMIPETIFTMFACFKIGAVAVPVFSGFAPNALAIRLKDSNAKILFTADGGYRREKTYNIKENANAAVAIADNVQKVIVFKHTGSQVEMTKKDVWFHNIVDNESTICETEVMDSEDEAIILFTSGTTGRPKGCIHTQGACIVSLTKELAYHFDLKPEDRMFWVTDIGWMMGPWEYIAATSLESSFIIYEGAPNYPTPDRLWKIINKHKATHLGISPTAIRILKKEGDSWLQDMPTLRMLGSTGEPWDPESYMWYFEKVGKGKCPIINVSGGTEIIGCFLMPLPVEPLKPCTLQASGLGKEMDVFDDNGRPVRGGVGHLVCKKPIPTMTRGFLNDYERYINTYFVKWPNVWYHGDWARIDEDGFWFLHGRSDETIVISGMKVGPNTVESALMNNPAVAEAAAIGVPDDIKTNAIVCYVVLKPSFQPSEELRKQLFNNISNSIGKMFMPKEIKFVSALPKTRSAKIVRRAIKAIYLGEDPGDISTLENPDALEAIKNAR